MNDDDINRDELYEIVLVINGCLSMGPGKVAGQAAQAIYRAVHGADGRSFDIKGQRRATFEVWMFHGTRTIVKYAKTEAMFNRVVNELEGYTMRDEGYTQVVAGAPTVFVAGPFLHKDRPKLLDNKKLPLL